jgi:hypothetical protein
MKHIFVILVVVMLFGQASAETKRFTIPLEGSPSQGPRDAAVTIVEFIDYQ